MVLWTVQLDSIMVVSGDQGAGKCILDRAPAEQMIQGQGTSRTLVDNALTLEDFRQLLSIGYLKDLEHVRSSRASSWACKRPTKDDDIHAKYDGSCMMQLQHERGRTGGFLI